MSFKKAQKKNFYFKPLLTFVSNLENIFSWMTVFRLSGGNLSFSLSVETNHPLPSLQSYSQNVSTFLPYFWIPCFYQHLWAKLGGSNCLALSQNWNRNKRMRDELLRAQPAENILMTQLGYWEAGTFRALAIVCLPSLLPHSTPSHVNSSNLFHPFLP